MATYTKHKLTDAQLRRLSVLVNGGKGATAGTAGQALLRKGLAVGSRPDPVEYGFPGWPVAATPAGVEALAQARREGW
jgi:hypothetical protein